MECDIQQTSLILGQKDSEMWLCTKGAGNKTVSNTHVTAMSKQLVWGGIKTPLIEAEMSYKGLKRLFGDKRTHVTGSELHGDAQVQNTPTQG